VPNLVIDENGDGVDDLAGPLGIMSVGLVFLGGKGDLNTNRYKVDGFVKSPERANFQISNFLIPIGYMS